MSIKAYRQMLCAMLAVVCCLICVTVFHDINSFTNKLAVSGNGEAAEKLYAHETGVEADLLQEGQTEKTVLGQSAENENTTAASEKTETVHMVMPSGKPIGIYVKTDGVMVIGTGEVKTKTGESCCPCMNLIESGDYITAINGMKVNDKEELISNVDKYGSSEVMISIKRKGQSMDVSVTPVLSVNDKYMLGLWVKDDISGIGTLTYIDENGFGALGHSINDNDTGELLVVGDGAIYNTQIINIVRTDGQSPGRLEGLIDYSSKNVIGRVNDNTTYGIKGYMTKNAGDYISSGEWMPIGRKSETHLGSALLLSSVSGEPKYYDVEITGIDICESSQSKGLEIKIKDPELLNLTSGIVQGMSGTPIIQDGKLVGAVTHVFLRDSTRGYGTFVEDMIE
ncbi:MAG: SpoIVB peptidase [Clostridium sp.]|nr:SpoIVB peptidase [Clostridium sp.]MCM1170496.1 SpoIVB peptidase [Clostridium sp.]MCM1208083.1 SpoIVB peptidase [Ruminococcus sp.]